ncbi:MAG: BPSS1780 family membrane protein [Chromatiales bacterium]
MNIKKVEADAGLSWLGEGWRLFKLNPGMWIALILIYFVVIVVLSFIPFIGALILALITPALATGLVHAARELDQGRDLAIEQLFAGLTDAQKRVPLLTLGAIYIGVAIVMVLIIFLLGGGAMMGGMMMGGAEPAAGAAAAAGGAGLIAIIAILIGIMIAMAFVYAGPLVMFQGVAPVDSIKASFNACAQNIVAFIVFGVILAVLAVIASLPLLLGWLVLGPVATGAIYASYKAILE